MVSIRRQSLFLFLLLAGRASACDLSALEARAKPFLLSDEEIAARCRQSRQAELDRATVKDAKGNPRQVSRCVYGYEHRRADAQSLLKQEKAACEKAEAASAAGCDGGSQATCLRRQRSLVSDAEIAHRKLATGLDAIGGDAKKAAGDHAKVRQAFLTDGDAIRRRVAELQAAGRNDEAARLLAAPRMSP